MFDPTKPVETRDGKPARIVSDKARGMFPFLSVVTYPDGMERIHHHTVSGSAMGFPGTHPDDLVNAPVETVRFLNFYPTGLGRSVRRPESGPIFYSTLKEASDPTVRAPGGVTLKVTQVDGTVTEVELANG